MAIPKMSYCCSGFQFTHRNPSNQDHKPTANNSANYPKKVPLLIPCQVGAGRSRSILLRSSMKCMQVANLPASNKVEIDDIFAISMDSSPKISLRWLLPAELGPGGGLT